MLRPTLLPRVRPPAARHVTLVPVVAFLLLLASLPTAPREAGAQVLATWQILGEGAQLRSPMGVAVDVAGSIYVADAGNHRVVKLDPSGRQVASWGGQGAAPGQFDNPSAVAVDGAGYVYVADTFNHRVQKLTPDGQVVLLVGELGSAPGQFRDPTGIAVDAEGTMYVADTRNNRVQKLTPEGWPLADWGRPLDPSPPPALPPFRRPAGLALDLFGRLVVADTDDARLALVSAETGQVYAGWASLGSPRGAAIDAYGRVYVADALGHRVELLAAEGAPLAGWGGEGGQAGEFRSPSGVALDGSGMLYVADTGNHRVQRLVPTGR